MKIGFPARNECSFDRAFLSKDFTNSGMIGIFDTETEKVELVSKDKLSTGLTDWLKEQDVNTIITPNLKLMALKVFREQNINVYKAEGTMLALNIQLYLSKKLKVYSTLEIQKQNSGACSTSDCGSCSSSCN